MKYITLGQSPRLDARGLELRAAFNDAIKNRLRNNACYASHYVNYAPSKMTMLRKYSNPEDDMLACSFQIVCCAPDRITSRTPITVKGTIVKATFDTYEIEFDKIMLQK